MKPCIVNIGGRKFYATLADRVSSVNGMYINGSLFRLSDKQDSEPIGCLSFFRSRTISAIWKPSVSSRDVLEELYILILPYIKMGFDPEKILKLYHNCFTIVIDTRDDGVFEDEVVVRGNGNAQELVERLVYAGKITDQKVRKQILQHLYDYWKFESHDTKLRVDKMQEVFFLPAKYFARNLDYLIQKQLVEPLYSNDQLISVKISPSGVEHVEGGFQKLPNSIKITQYMGDQINTTIKGNANVVNIKSELNQLFQSLEVEIESKNEVNKEKVLKQVSELKAEMKGPKDFNKIQAILRKIKKSASWVHEKIVKHPVISQVIAQAVAAKIGLSTPK